MTAKDNSIIPQGRRGLLVAFEGIDGTGKSTQIEILAAKLREMRYAVVTTREPTDGRYGRMLRALFLDREKVAREEELRLFIEDRREHVAEVIAPALAAGRIVLTDRYYLSTVAYQGAAGLDPEDILERNERFAPRPDLALLLVAPPAMGRERIERLRGERPNEFEKEEYLGRVAAIFAAMKGEYIRRIDARGSVAEVHRAIMTQVHEILRRRKSAC